MPTTVRIKNHKHPAPKWFRKLKSAIAILVLAANVMVASWGLENEILVTRIQLWCTVGIGALMEAFERLLADPDDEEEPIVEPVVEPFKKPQQ